MAGQRQFDFCEGILNRFPQFKTDVRVLDVGSLDINGNNKYMFVSASEYIGIDLAKGDNVDVISRGHEYDSPDNSFDIIISTECFEHDMFYKETIKNIYRMLKSKGMFLFTCASTGRPEHGTKRTTPEDSPFTSEENYYKNLTEGDIREIFNVDELFSEYSFIERSTDLYFYGIKK